MRNTITASVQKEGFEAALKQSCIRETVGKTRS